MSYLPLLAIAALAVGLLVLTVADASKGAR